ncbi:uncharacterized protein DUF4382 [Algoriphagus ratkowskyi]|uniref:DUF4382 domain-containing protein n=1 Tax=Algoriphagus ratkowskyi TaxID=57028 RepID=A0A2W7RBH2_9BACT|nr:DUF4382 domain-containing protein [Algoriphagus ratkowskyi]PZX58333.1 uncharacterized protein DUF4382 [Algoriphagus ratkowskyi]TXD77792.1 DUF4382 domain-containing protein [Algoriphagus ratkowskyi]
MKNIFSYILLTGLALIAMSCTSDDENPSSDTARVNIRLVDAPASYDEVWVEVLAVRVKVDKEGIDDDNDDDSSWNEITYNESQPINLLDLTGGNSKLLGTEDFPEGKIDQLRLILGENNYVIKKGQRHDMKTPSAQQSGLKIKVDERIEGGMTYNLVIDFDAAKSIVEAGNSGQIILKPVLRAYLDEISAGIMGQILPLEAQPVKVTAQKGDDTMNTFVDAKGNYKITGLDQGTYKLIFTPNDSYSPVELEGVLVENGKLNSINPIVLKLK